MTRRNDVHLNFDDAALYALELGDAEQSERPTLIFFHGGLADHRAALRVVGGLGDRLRVITPDLRGAGRSRWAGALSWDRLAEDAGAWIRHAGSSRLIVGGVSMGSAVALRAALSFPGQLAGLVLAHPVYPGSALGLTDAPRVAMEGLDALGRRAVSEGISVFYPLFDELPESIRDRARAMLDSFDPASVAATTRLLGSGAQPFDTLDELAGVRCPALVVPGRDPQHPAEVATLLAGALPDARLVVADEAGLPEVIAGFCWGVGGG